MKDLEQKILRNPPTENFLEEKFRSFGFEQLTNIQKKAIPVIYQKKNSLIIAPTGSGKTECSVIPIFSHVKKTKEQGKIKVLYITPLRALNRDVFRRIIKYAEQDCLTIQIRHGDTSQTMRKKISDSPPDILITTPETLVILLTQKKMLTALSELEWVIIDEVHELLASERGSQLSISLERLQLNSNQQIIRNGLSATIGNTDEAAKFLVGTNRPCEIVQDQTIRNYQVEVKFVGGSISEVADSIIQYVEKSNLDSPILLFTNTRGESEFLASILKEKTTMNIELHHGSLSKQVREETESVLRSGANGIVVCTSSLELGLDIGSVELVIHYGSPRQVSKLVQRIGRSRHSKNSSARGLVISNSGDDEFEATAILDRIKNSSIEEQKINEKSLDVLAHHLVGLSLQIGEVTVDFAYKIIKQAYPFRNLTLDEFCSVLEILDSIYILFFDKEKMKFWKKRNAYRYYYENLSTIPDILKFKVFDSVGKKIIGSLDQRFVGDFGEPGNIFVLRGMQWIILNVDEKLLQINVEPVTGGGKKVPYWEGENIPVDFDTAQKVGLLRTKVKQGSLSMINKIISELDYNIIPDEKTIVVESLRTEGTLVIHACFGSRINSTLATILSSFLSSTLGYVVESRSDAYRIVLTSNARIRKKIFVETLIEKFNLYDIISVSLTGTHNVNWRTWCVAKKFGIVSRGSIYDRKSGHFLYERYQNTPVVKESLRELFHDKFDLTGTEDIITRIRNNEIQIEWIDVDKFSKLAEPLLDHTTKYYSSPASVDKAVLDLVKKRLFKTKHRLVCARCGKWQLAIITKEAKENLICKYCKSRQITSTFYSDYDLVKIIQKKHKGKKLSSEENHKFKRAWKVASLIQTFGKNAIIVLSGYGIGADTAARILRNLIDEEIMYKQIYEAERQYVMTRGFWDD
jgi:ATP-dependent Lhr-like helicase